MADILSIGSSGLSAYRRSLEVTGNNIANANTEGYARRDTQLQGLGEAAFSPTNLQTGSGSGVAVDVIRRATDVFVQSEKRMTQSASSAATALSDRLTRLEKAMFSGDGDLSKLSQNFFSRLQDFSTTPSSIAVRTTVLQAASDLSDGFKTQAERLSNEATSIISDAQSQFDNLNALTKQLADLNKQIDALAGDKGQANDLLDQRDKLVDNIVQIVGVTVESRPSGAVNLYLGRGTGGPQLVGANGAKDLAASRVNGHLQITMDPYGASIPISQIQGGTIGGIQSYDSQITSMASELDRMAVGFAKRINDQHAKGTDLDGNKGQQVFSTDTLTITPSKTNKGISSASLNMGQVGAVEPGDYQATFSQEEGTWTVINMASGKRASGSNQVSIDGMTLSFSGKPADGDSYQFAPLTGAAVGMRAMITDPRQLAASLPQLAEASSSNSGSATIELTSSGGAVDQPAIPSLSALFNPSIVPNNSMSLKQDGMISSIPSGSGPVTLYSFGELSAATFKINPPGSTTNDLSSLSTIGPSNLTLSIPGSPPSGSSTPVSMTLPPLALFPDGVPTDDVSQSDPAQTLADEINRALKRNATASLPLDQNYFASATNGFVTINALGSNEIYAASISSPTITSGAISSAGSGYQAGATYTGVALAGGSGKGATATITIGTDGKVSKCVITNGGNGYAQGDALSIDMAGANAPQSGSGFSFTVSSVGSRPIRAGSITAMGSGYGTTAATYQNVSLNGGSGTGALATITVDQFGRIANCEITNAGSGYQPGDILGINAANNSGLPSGYGFNFRVTSVDSGMAASANATITKKASAAELDLLTTEGIQLAGSTPLGSYLPPGSSFIKTSNGFSSSAFQPPIKLPAVIIQPTATNTGTATATISNNHPTIDNGIYQATYDLKNKAWIVVNTGTGAHVTGKSSVSIDGITINFSGAPADGDSFNIGVQNKYRALQVTDATSPLSTQINDKGQARSRTLTFDVSPDADNPKTSGVGTTSFLPGAVYAVAVDGLDQPVRLAGQSIVGKSSAALAAMMADKLNALAPQRRLMGTSLTLDPALTNTTFTVTLDGVASTVTFVRSIDKNGNYLPGGTFTVSGNPDLSISMVPADPSAPNGLQKVIIDLPKKLSTTPPTLIIAGPDISKLGLSGNLSEQIIASNPSNNITQAPSILSACNITGLTSLNNNGQIMISNTIAGSLNGQKLNLQLTNISTTTKQNRDALASLGFVGSDLSVSNDPPSANLTITSSLIDGTANLTDTSQTVSRVGHKVSITSNDPNAKIPEDLLVAVQQNDMNGNRTVAATFSSADRRVNPVMPDIEADISDTGVVSIYALQHDANGTLITDANGEPLRGSLLATRKYEVGEPITYMGSQFMISGNANKTDRFRITTDPNRTGDNRNAMALIGLSQNDLFDHGSGSFAEIYTAAVSKIGSSSQAAQTSAEAAKAIADNVAAAYSSETGVNLDTEASELIKLQQAYTACAQVVSTARDMFAMILKALGG